MGFIRSQSQYHKHFTFRVNENFIFQSINRSIRSEAKMDTRGSDTSQSLKGCSFIVPTGMFARGWLKHCLPLMTILNEVGPDGSRDRK